VRRGVRLGHDGGMGEAAMAVALVLIMPVAIIMSGGIAAVILGSILNAERKSAHEGNELLDLNR
jgi:hypothetical protein